MNRLSIATLVAFLLFLPAITQAQAQIGVKGGLNFSKYGDDELKSMYNRRAGGDAEAFITFPVTETFSWQLGLEYASLGARKTSKDQQILNTDAQVPSMSQEQMLYGDVTFNTALTYLMLPIQAKFDIYISKHLGVYVDAGPYIGYLIAAQQKITTDGTYYTDNTYTTKVSGQKIKQKQDILSYMPAKVAVGFEGEVGIKYTVSRYNFFAEGGYNYLLGNIGKKADNQPHSAAIIARIGVSYNFRGK